jgi:hypothetical protein
VLRISPEWLVPEERCFISEGEGVQADPALSVARARVEPGVTTSWHAMCTPPFGQAAYRDAVE